MNKRQSDRGIQDIQAIARSYLKKILKPGDIVIDATAGRGRDTVFLAECVGESGKVFAFDIQEEALLSTKELIEKQGLAERVVLIAACHSEIRKYVADGLAAAVFNLGYLPGSGKKLTTKADTTVKAVVETLYLIRENGIIFITVYRGHSGSREESEALLSFLSELSKKEFSVFQGIYLNQGETSPYWIMIQKNRRIINESPSAEKNPGTDK